MCPSLGNLVRNPGLCPNWESNRQPFGSQADTQPTEVHQPGLHNFYNQKKNTFFKKHGQRKISPKFRNCPEKWGLSLELLVSRCGSCARQDSSQHAEPRPTPLLSRPGAAHRSQLLS